MPIRIPLRFILMSGWRRCLYAMRRSKCLRIYRCRAGALLHRLTPCAALNAYAFIAVGLAPYKSKIARDWPSTQVSSSSLLLFYPCMACSLRKVSLQKSFECLTMSSLISCHFMHCVMDSVEV